MTQTDPPAEQPICEQGGGIQASGAPPVDTRVCPFCRQQKPALAFDDELGMCILCKYKTTGRATGKRKSRGAAQKPTPPRTRKCPVCLQTVTVIVKAGDWTLDSHFKETRAGVTECRGGGRVIYPELRDAMEHVLPGSFEAGKRR